MVETVAKHRCPRIAPGLLLALLLAVDCCHALFRPVERGPCQAKNPLGPGFSDGICMPMVKCKETLRGIVRLNFPVICGIELLSPIVCCPIMNGPAGHGPSQNRGPNPFSFLGGIFGNIPGSSKPGFEQEGPFGPYGLNIPGVHSFEGYLEFLGFLPPAQGVGEGPFGPYGLNIPGVHSFEGPSEFLGFLPPVQGVGGHNFGGGPGHQGFPGGHGVQTGSGQGPNTGVIPHPQGSFGGHEGGPTTGGQGPNTGVRQPPHNGRPTTGGKGPNTGVGQPHPDSVGGHGRPMTDGDGKPMTGVQGGGTGPRPHDQGPQGGHKMPMPTDQGNAPSGPSCGESDCPPSDGDDIIHLIDPRRGKP